MNYSVTFETYNVDIYDFQLYELFGYRNGVCDLSENDWYYDKYGICGKPNIEEIENFSKFMREFGYSESSIIKCTSRITTKHNHEGVYTRHCIKIGYDYYRVRYEFNNEDDLSLFLLSIDVQEIHAINGELK